MNTSEIIQQYQSLLFSIAYQMTGEVVASEDIVQEVLTNLIIQQSESITYPKAYLAKAVTNRSLNYLVEAKRRRESYKGTWLPEPVIENAHRQVEAQLDLSYSFMLLLEKLTPTERAIFLLKESFEFDYQEIATALDINEANARQLYHRAKEKIGQPKKRFVSSTQHQQALLEAFTQASISGDLDTFIQLLKEDIVIYSDGGGKVLAAINPLFGKLVAEKFYRGLANKNLLQLEVKPVMVNGSPALATYRRADQQLDAITIIETENEGVARLFIIRNPEKLAHLVDILYMK
ncbi:MAG: sigma-70 family RNA polymerase sigma factor [Saprospiraceae bacterium]